MALVAPNTMVVTPDGLNAARHLRCGDLLLAVYRGGAEWIKLEGTHAVENAELICVYASSGDITFGQSSSIVTSEGLTPGSSLLERRAANCVGFMSGDWPHLEMFLPGDRQFPTGPACSLRDEILAAAITPAESFRVGAWPDETLRKSFDAAPESLLIGDDSNGWKWVGIGADTTLQPPNDLSLLWRSDVADNSAVLSIDEETIRAATLLQKRLQGEAYSVSYEPRYTPLVAKLRPGDAAGIERTVIQSVRPVTASAVELIPSKNPAYLIGNGFLCM